MIIRPAAQWGGSSSQSQPCGPGPGLSDSQSQSSSVESTQPASGNIAIGVFSTDQNAVPSTSKDTVLLRLQNSTYGPLPQLSNPLPSTHPGSRGTALFTPANADSQSVKVAVVSPHRTERNSGAEAPFPPQERPTDTPQASQVALEPEERRQQQQEQQPIPRLSPARLQAFPDDERPGPSRVMEPPAPQAAQQNSTNTLVKRVVGFHLF